MTRRKGLCGTDNPEMGIGHPTEMRIVHFLHGRTFLRQNRVLAAASAQDYDEDGNDANRVDPS